MEDKNVNNLIIPILKDTIEDYKKSIFKMFIIIIAQIIALLIVITYCATLFSQSNKKYVDFVTKCEIDAVENINETK